MSTLVIGRVPDKENEYRVYQNTTPEKAKEKFIVEMMYEWGEGCDKDNVIFEVVATSKSPIDIDTWQD
jgi:hypothetical protein